MFKLLLIFADPVEASETLALFPFSARSEFLYSYSTETALLDVIILKQWGHKGVLQALTPTPIGYDLWLNLGFAGAGNPCIPLLRTYTITSVRKCSDQMSLGEELLVIPVPKLPLAQLTSVTSPYREGFNPHLQLVDMEGFSIAQQAALVSCPCSMIKISSDYTTQQGRSFLQSNKARLSKKLADAFSVLYASFNHKKVDSLQATTTMGS
jgi:hypothetical protein